MTQQKLSTSLVLAIALVSYLAISFSGASSTANRDEITKIPKIFDFGEYVAKFSKAYSPVETIAKAQLFLSRTLKIFQHNAQFATKKIGYFLRQNEFTDMYADEIQKQHAGGQDDLAPVAEALTNPDLPADQSLSVQKMNAELGNDESFSRSTAEDLESNAKYDKETQRVKPFVNFLDDQKVSNLKFVFGQLKDIPDSVKVEMERMVEMSDVKLDESRKIEKARHRNKIQTKPVVKSDNPHYEPQTAPSFGLADSHKESQPNYAKFMMDDMFLGLNMDPYPVPDEYQKQEVDPQNGGKEGERKSFLSSFMDSVAAVGDLLYPSDDEDDDNEAQEHDREAEAILQQAKAQLLAENQVKLNEASNVPKYNIDWRKTGCINQIQNQKACQSCYAFSVLSMMEYLYCRQTSELTTFSAQYIVDCGHLSQLNGCRGSKISNVGQFIRNYGLELSSNYPYVGLENQCPYTDAEVNGTPIEKAAGYMRPSISRWQMFQDMASWFKWLRKSPLIVGINMPSDFLAYGGGVHDGLDCVPGMTHAMLLVGSGFQDGREFWLLKNSYSDVWGEAGYFKLSKSAPLRCFDSAIVVRASFNGGNNNHK